MGLKMAIFYSEFIWWSTIL